MEQRQTWWQPVLWFLAGALVGFGLLAFDIFFLFIPCVIVGLCLIIMALIRWGSRRLWLALLGFGLIPALFLLNDILSSLNTCPANGVTVPAGTSFSCSGPLPSTYYVLFAISGIIAVIAGVWPLVRRAVKR